MEPKDARRQLFEWQAQFAAQQQRSTELAQRAAELREAHGPLDPTAENVDLLAQRIDLLQEGQATIHQHYLEISLVIVDVIERVNELGREGQ